ncbi:serine/threonine-protein kinase [Halorubrum ezzemoulense]|nr:serine/threonine-protein kinase [Halorubrum ezzemoulense]MDB2245253.1 serine/threonine-protein kinase [Halorubrum ezzemoulense]MDB2290109.1 serine/threonine-protein kinase [Halorubrum ezzemoulense]MDB2297579.1 serine/threonine-protein kinase [Halorubrum ezzemoulense]MDB2301159.1 serine/threonine-protein kinase [Halorubrum ezzemoulense]
MTDEQVPDLSTVESPPRRADIEYGMVKNGELIGSGGQAVVRRTSLPGRDPPDTVAVKEPQAPSQTIPEETAESFFEEATTWQKLARRERKGQYGETDHIVGVVAIGEQLPWVAMEYMDAGSLADRLDAHPDGLPVEEALWIGESLCKGVKLAHDNGVAHLDLKPENVLFRETPNGVWDVPKIADWGLARALIEDSRSMDAMSVEYAAPEQFDPDKFGKPDSYTDIYQVGAIIYEMITGCPPYTGGQAAIMHDVVYGDDPATLSSRRQDVPPALEDIVLQALTSEKPQRYRGSIDRLEDALRDIRQGGATTTDPNGTADTTTSADSHETGDWPMYGREPSRASSVSEYSGPELPLSPKWSFSSPFNLITPPIVTGNTVYIGSNKLYAIDLDTGEEVWSFDVGTLQISSAESDRGVNSYSELSISAKVDQPPVVIDGDIVFCTTNGGVYSLDCNTGTRNWGKRIEDKVQAAPCVVDKSILLPTSNYLYSINRSGSVNWTLNFDNLSGVAIGDSCMFATELTGRYDPDKIHKIDQETQEFIWTSERGDEDQSGYKTTYDPYHTSNPIYNDGTLYVGGRGLSAIEPTTGDGLWRSSSNSDRLFPSVTEEMVFAGCTDGGVKAFDSHTGELKWSTSQIDRIESSPVVANNRLYVGDKSGKIYALDTQGGAILWKHDTKQNFTSDGISSNSIASIRKSPIALRNAILVGNNNGRLYKFG